jgi:restriction system protein
MAEITRRRTGELLRKLFEILLANPEGTKAGTALTKLAEKVTLTEYEKGTFTDGALRFDKIVRFATVDCVKAGWLRKEKGIWTVTDDGVDALKRYPDPEGFYKEACRLYHVWKRGQGEHLDATVSEADIPEPAILEEPSFEEYEEKARTEIETRLRKMPWLQFQKLFSHLLTAMGYHVVWEAQTGQKGSDIIAFQDPLGAQGPRIRVEVKREQNPIDLDRVKSFVSTIGSHEVGVYVSVSGFTGVAGDYARNHETRRITLVNAEKLVELWTQHSRQLTDEARDLFDLKPIYFLAPRD